MNLNPELDRLDQVAVTGDTDETQVNQNQSEAPSPPQNQDDNHGVSVIAEQQLTPSPSTKPLQPVPTVTSASASAADSAAAVTRNEGYTAALHQQQLQAVMKENVSLKDKVNKLKDLLAKSSKATRDIKAELDTQKSALDKAHADIQRLNIQVHVLSKRPTHLDWMTNFENNVERALWNVQIQNQNYQSQSGGEDPSSFTFLTNFNTTTNQTLKQQDEEDKPQGHNTGNSYSIKLDEDEAGENHILHNYSKSYTNRENSIHDSLLDRMAILEEEKQMLLKQQIHGNYFNNPFLMNGFFTYIYMSMLFKKKKNTKSCYRVFFCLDLYRSIHSQTFTNRVTKHKNRG